MGCGLAVHGIVWPILINMPQVTSPWRVCSEPVVRCVCTCTLETKTHAKKIQWKYRMHRGQWRFSEFYHYARHKNLGTYSDTQIKPIDTDSLIAVIYMFTKDICYANDTPMKLTEITGNRVEIGSSLPIITTTLNWTCDRASTRLSLLVYSM